jgi:hypothetical protein
LVRKADFSFSFSNDIQKENTKNENYCSPILALVTMVGTFALFGIAFFMKMDGANEKVLFMVIGALSSIATTVVRYYFGSSEGSARKNEIFQGMKDKI